MPWETRSFIAYARNDLVSHGKSDTDKKCWGTYDPTTGIGYGPGYQYNCIHSSSTEHSGGDTIWYNYPLASAGTITDENTTSNNPANNINTATESVCPNGWTLPTTKQVGLNTDITNFSPVLGGDYTNGTQYHEDTYGFWWGSTAYNSASRYRLNYNRTSLYNNNFGYHNGIYIRCVSEEKTVLDLTYMQDMTPEINGMLK